LGFNSPPALLNPFPSPKTHSQNHFNTHKNLKKKSYKRLLKQNGKLMGVENSRGSN
jgi:hypothetical protein